MYANLRKERFPRGMYNKHKLKNFGPSKIYYNVYVLELLEFLGTSSKFDISNLYKFEEGLMSGGETIVYWQ